MSEPWEAYLGDAAGRGVNNAEAGIGVLRSEYDNLSADAMNALDEIKTRSAGTAGDLASLSDDRFARLDLRYPLDVEGPEQRHFIKFTINKIRGQSLESGAARTSAEENAEGSFIQYYKNEIKKSNVGTGKDADGGFISDAINVVGGAYKDVNTVASKIIGGTEKLINKVTEPLIGQSLGSSALGGLASEGLDALGGVVNYPGSIGAIASGVFDALSGGKRSSLGHIVLYMPHQINESYRTQWTGSAIGFTGALGADAYQNYKGGMSTWETMKAAAKSGEDAVTATMVNRVAGAIGEEALADLYFREAGRRAINPHMEQFFKTVDFRNFSYTFKFSPRNQKEAIEVQDIIRAFKFYSAPSYYSSDVGAFWKYPNEFNIEYFNKDFTHKIGSCACTGIDINYAGAGVNATFYDGRPIETDMTLNFVELSLMTKKNFQKNRGVGDKTVGGF